MHRFSYVGGHLDRVAAGRKDPVWLETTLTHPMRRIVPLWRNRNLVATDAAGESSRPVLLMAEAASEVLSLATETVLLGLDGEVPVIAAEVPAAKEWSHAPWAQGGEFVDLRRVGSLLAGPDAAMLAYARGLLYWHRHHRFCGRCGKPTVSCDGGAARACCGAGCGRRVFPRIDPAVIMLVEYRPPGGGEPLCLLGRHARLPAGMYSTLAGFVEPGESLEEAVAREVREEVGVAVGTVDYQGSQPWPFPASIMLGFRARAESTRIAVDDDELEDAQWFTVDQVRNFGEWGDVAAERSIPRRDSIARYLIESWISEMSGSSDPGS